MSSTPVRALVIAPYEGLRQDILRSAEAFSDIQADVWVGNLEEAAIVVKSLDLDRYDVVISRGGTASLLRPLVPLPVVDIGISMYDVLKVIHLAHNYTDRYAILGFKNVTESAHILCGIMNYAARIITLHSSEDVLPALDSLAAEDYQLVICDVVSHESARQHGMTSLLITSGPESLHNALELAGELGRLYRNQREENRSMRRVLTEENLHFLSVGPESQVIRSIPDEPPPELKDALLGRLPELKRTQKLEAHLEAGGLPYSVSGYSEPEGGVTFIWKEGKKPLRQSRPGIRSLSQGECSQLFSASIFSVSGAIAPLESRISALAESRQPVMIYGEVGTGKEQIARAIYLRSGTVRKPLVVIDCSVLDERSWNYLFTHQASPFAGSGQTLLLKHAEAIPEKRQREILSLMQSSGLTRRQRILLSCSCPSGEELPPLFHTLSEQMGCTELQLSPFRTRLGELPALAEQYLKQLNKELHKELKGFEPGALELMRSYDWPNNYTQFKQCLYELATLTASGYISTDSAAGLLARERTRFRPIHSVTEGLPFKGKTLEEITLEAVQQALRDNKDNQSAAARQLGVSRTTLWRYLARIPAQQGEKA